MGPHYYWGSLRTYLELHGQLATPPSPTRALSLSKRGANRLKRVLAALSDVADQVPDIVDSIKSKIEAAENLSKYNAQKPGQACFLQLLHDLWTFRLGRERAPDKVTRSFLEECAQPVFPQLTDNAIDVWLRRHRRQWPHPGQPGASLPAIRF